MILNPLKIKHEIQNNLLVIIYNKTTLQLPHLPFLLFTINHLKYHYHLELIMPLESR